MFCFKDMAAFIVFERRHNDRDVDANEERLRIVRAGVRLTKEQIRAKNYSKEEYPSGDEIRNCENDRSF